MSSVLLDVNVIIALLDPTHAHHRLAHRWFFDGSLRPWLTCPTTENGVIRVMGHPKYSNSQPIPIVMESLDSLVALPGHRRIPDDASLLSSRVDRTALLSSAQVTDTYLALLAQEHSAQLATFDRRLSTRALTGAQDLVLQIPG